MSALHAYRPKPAPVAHGVGASMASAHLFFILPQAKPSTPARH